MLLGFVLGVVVVVFLVVGITLAVVNREHQIQGSIGGGRGRKFPLLVALRVDGLGARSRGRVCRSRIRCLQLFLLAPDGFKVMTY